MKVRLGFVSNSSSSSFVLIANREDFLKAYKDLHESLKELIRYEASDGACNINGKPAVVLVEHENTEDNCFLEDYGGNKFITSDGKEIIIEQDGEDYDFEDNDIITTKYGAFQFLADKIIEQGNSCVLKDLDC